MGENGEVGSLLRRGRGQPSSACGALKAILGDVNAKKAVVEDELDYEYVALKKKVLKQVGGRGRLPFSHTFFTFALHLSSSWTTEIQPLLSRPF